MLRTIIYWLIIIPFMVYYSFKVYLCYLFKCGDLEKKKIMQSWGNFLIKLSGSSIEIIGLDNLDLSKNYIFAANHQSAFDIFALSAALPVRFYWLSKKQYFKVPFIGRAMRMLGFISIDRKHFKRSLNDLEYSVQTIKEKHSSVAIFPEGTRSLDGKLQKFKRGAILIAIKTKIPVVPVTIIGTYEISNKRRLTIKPNKIKIIFSQPITIAGENKEYQIALLNQIRSEIEQNLE